MGSWWGPYIHPTAVALLGLGCGSLPASQGPGFSPGCSSKELPVPRMWRTVVMYKENGFSHMQKLILQLWPCETCISFRQTRLHKKLFSSFHYLFKYPSRQYFSSFLLWSLICGILEVVLVPLLSNRVFSRRFHQIAAGDPSWTQQQVLVTCRTCEADI